MVRRGIVVNSSVRSLRSVRLSFFGEEKQKEEQHESGAFCGSLVSGPPRFSVSVSHHTQSQRTTKTQYELPSYCIRRFSTLQASGEDVSLKKRKTYLLQRRITPSSAPGTSE